MGYYPSRSSATNWMIKVRRCSHYLILDKFTNFCSKIAAKRFYCVSINIEGNALDEISLKHIFSLNSHLNSYTRNGKPIDTLNLFRQMHCIRYDLDAYTFTPVLGACAALFKPVLGRQTHALMIKLNLDMGMVTKTTLIDMYSTCDELEDSVRVFDGMGSKDVVAWNTMLSAYLRHGLPSKALDSLKYMKMEGVNFSEVTLCSALTACGSLKAYKQGKQIHGLIIIIGRDMVILSTALVVFYSNLGQIDEAMKVYRTLNRRKDDIMHNALISSCVRNKRYDAALTIASEFRPNLNALTSAVSACSENLDLSIGKQLHGVATRQGFTHDTQLCNTILDMYAKSGKIRDASLLFESMNRKNVVSWTTLIDAYGRHGYGIEALDLFKTMDVSPNSVTFLAVLSACGHSGLVQQGRKCFSMAQEKYGLVPGPEHYACLIDMFGRAGEIEQVWSLFDELVEEKGGAEVSNPVWSALLNACRVNQDATRGEIVAKRLLEMEPNKTANYVSVSNLFAEVGRWDVVDKLRGVLKEKGMSKGEGHSLVSHVRFS